jgi:hypothetical protein
MFVRFVRIASIVSTRYSPLIRMESPREMPKYAKLWGAVSGFQWVGRGLGGQLPLSKVLFQR